MSIAITCVAIPACSTSKAFAAADINDSFASPRAHGLLEQFEQWGIQAGCWQSDAPSCCYCYSITWQIEMLIWILILSSSSPDVAATGLGFPAMQKIASTRSIGGPFSGMPVTLRWGIDDIHAKEHRPITEQSKSLFHWLLGGVVD